MIIWPLLFITLAGFLNNFWWFKNRVTLKNMPRTMLVTVLVWLFMDLASMVARFIFTLGAIVSPTHWAFVFVGAAGLSISMFVKVTAVKAPPNLWHFTERNRRLVAEGRIARFHLENGLAALLPLLLLIWRAHYFR